jgi:hypothetical protein
VVFRLANGTLSSMHLSELDLEASERLTTSRSRPVQKPQKRTRTEPEKSKFIITDDDVKHVNPASARAEGDEGEPKISAPAAAREESEGEGVAVSQWDTVYDEAIDGVVPSGTLENRDSRGHQELALAISLVSEGGVPAGRAHAALAKNALKGGESTTFRASFPGVPDFEKAEFGISGASLPTEQAPSQATATVASGAPVAADSVASEPDLRQVEAFVRAWAAAWAGQRVSDYLGFYAPDFVPAAGMSRGDWVTQRR